MAVLLEDIYSFLRGRELYGRRGDKVEIISTHENVSIVEGARWIEGDEQKKKKTFAKAGTHRYPVNIQQINF